jgi:hypothetical protein
MSDTPDDIGQKLTRLGHAILDDLLAPGNATLLEHKIAALKAIGTLHLGMAKLDGRMDDDGGAMTNFAALRDRATAGGK